jgi:pyrimidine-specific ribonucleoside hydrolase
MAPAAERGLPARVIDAVWDMETGDPDDFLTLLLLADHPAVRLRAVTVTPGTPDQIGLVRWALARLGKGELPVGAFDLARDKRCVSAWHYRVYGEIPPSYDAAPAAEVLLAACNAGTTLITGAPLRNLGAAIRSERGLVVGRWVAQGGFAGEGVVPPEHQLAKFAGMTTCPTYNLNGDPQSALLALAYPGIAARRFVSKNVCHGVSYDAAMHARIAEVRDARPSLQLIWQGMEAYLRKHPAGKKFHDPLAACCAIDEQIGTWAEVELYRDTGGWGARPAPGSGTWIIVAHDQERFVRVLTAT